jgi:glycosyltransferase involved in cell wall biosynthesis
MPLKVALLCSGLGHIVRGHEVFARGLFDMLADSLDITLFKGGGEPLAREWVIPNVPRNSPRLETIHVAVSPKWAGAVQEQERLRIEHETFAYAALGPLLEGEFDVVHCLEQEVCNIVHDNRHVFRRPPKVLFSNGGAIPAALLPRCDAVQEHTPYNFERSAREKAFMIPHGVDVQQFRPGLPTNFRQRHGIPPQARLLLSVGTVCYHHKRMDHVIREVAQLDGVYLAIVGQENADTPAIMALGRELLGERVVFDKLPHDELPQAYAAADAFVLGSLSEAFGIVYVEAMAAGLPVFCTRHPNQRLIVQEGVFVDMAVPGALAAALRDTPPQRLAELEQRGRQIAEAQYDLKVLKQKYMSHYLALAQSGSTLPRYTRRTRLTAHLRNALRRPLGWLNHPNQP